MQALVIYDNSGNVWNITYGDSVKPERISSARLEIPDGSQITGVDLSDPENPQPVFESIPASDYTKLQEQIWCMEREIQDQSDDITENNVDQDYRISLMEVGI